LAMVFANEMPSLAPLAETVASYAGQRAARRGHRHAQIPSSLRLMMGHKTKSHASFPST
jgi:hypothetical protein